ncbi:MAG: thiolase family protein, partial [Rhizobiaceae bacterium]|nr:thiolase family protein [Rhizobiaceae bacterium]
MAAVQRKRQGYNGVVLAAPVTVPYERFSTESAHHWIARALHALLVRTSLAQADIDGFCMASFTAGPDTAIGLCQ